MGVVVAFDYAQWSATYPEFSGLVDATQAQNYFDIATAIHRNDGGGPVNSAAQQLALLNMLTAHIATMFGPTQAGASATPTGIVGRVSSAAEGSVSVQSAAYSTNVFEQMAWFIQTKYGAMYWTATAPFRTARYIPSKNRGVVGPPGFGV